MSSSTVGNAPLAVRKFIFRCIDSVEQIKILLILREDPTREWTTEELTAELRSSSAAVEKRLRELYDRKVLCKTETTDKHRYIPSSNEVQEEIDQVSKYNQTHPVRVIELIYSRGEEAIREFANAFKFKKEK